MSTRSPELTSRNRPLIVGCSIGTRSGMVGSIGAFATREGRIGFITSPAALGVFGSHMTGESVFQPGAVGGAGLSERTRIGSIAAVVSEISDTPLTRYGAFVDLFDDVPVDTGLPVTVGAWRAFNSVSDDPIEGMIGAPVAKIGCATGLTFGEVTGIMTTLLLHVTGRSRPIRFGGLIEIGSRLQPFSLPSDGGAAVFNPITGSVLGLLVAGAEGQEPRSYAVPLLPILGELGVALVLA